jgi:predicted lactoylglutathione lyase
MHKQIYVNLPVADLPRSRAFFESLVCTSSRSSATTRAPAW